MAQLSELVAQLSELVAQLSELVAQFCNPATGGLELRDGWRRPGPTDLEEGQFQDHILPS